MNPSRLLGALVLAALIAAPSLAVAQPYGNYGNNGNGSGDNRFSGQVTGIVQSVQGSSFTLDNGRTVFLRQETVLSPTGLRLRSGMQVTVTGVWAGDGAINASEVANYGNNGNGSWDNRSSGQVTGIIQSVQGSSFTLDNGRTVFLTQGTVLSPTGLRLRSGMQVTVTGVRAGNGAINASEVANYGNNGNYGNYGNNGYNGNGNWYNRFNGQVTGIIQSVQGSSFMLDSGRTVFLKRGTIISPQGWRLRSGMQVTVTGVRAGNGAINASEVDIVRRNYQE